MTASRPFCSKQTCQNLARASINQLERDVHVCDCKTATKGHNIHCIQFACLVNVCYAYWPEMYWHVFWLMRLCILVHFQMYLGGHSLISICCSCFVEFITLATENLSTKGKLTTVVLSYNHLAGPIFSPPLVSRFAQNVTFPSLGS